MAKRILRESSVELEDGRRPDWRWSTAPPSAWMNVDGNHIALNGAMPAGYGLFIGYIDRPVPMVADDDTPDARIQETYHQHLKYAAASYLLTQAGGEAALAKADKLFNEFLGLIGAGKSPVAQNPVDK